MCYVAILSRFCAVTGCFQETSEIASLPAVLQLLMSHVLLFLTLLLYRVLEASANAAIILTFYYYYYYYYYYYPYQYSIVK